MAVSGSGTSTDPYIVDNWADFLTVNVSGKYVKFANPSRTITGDGSSGNPWVVSTYEEMLTKTGADYVWQIKLIDRTAKKYKYHKLVGYDEHNEPIYDDIFCLYKDEMTTIDSNNIELPTNLIIYASVDYNGWTMANIVRHGNSDYITIGNDVESIKNLRLKNFTIDGYYESGANYAGCLNLKGKPLINSSVDIHCNSNSGGTLFITKNAGKITNSNITIIGTGQSVSSAPYSNIDSYTANNTVINYDVELEGTYTSSIWHKDCLFKGKIANGEGQTNAICSNATDCVFDVETGGATKKNACYGHCIVNKDKLSNLSDWVTDNLYQVDSATIKSATDLAALGFPIGVDEQ